jgi:fatty acid amide hydrolase
MQTILPQPGFLARSVDDLYLGLSVLLPADESLAADEVPASMPHPAQVDVGRLRIGLVDDDGFFAPAPAIRRAVHEAGDALRAVGAEVEPLVLPDVARAVRLYLQLISADGGVGFRQLLGSSRRDWRIRRLMRMAMLPRGARTAIVAGMLAAGQRKLADLVRWTGKISSEQYWRLTLEHQEYVRRFQQELLDRRIDALILPPHALPALTHGASMHLPLAASYCLLINLLGFPSGVAPITQVQAGEESDRPVSRQIVDRAALLTERGSAGLPVGVQVVAGPWREDIVLAVMGALERAFPLKLPDDSGFARSKS